MNPLLIIIAAAAAQQPSASAEEQIVVTASLAEIPAEEAPASVSVFDAEQIDTLAPVLVADLLRLAPGVAIATTGPRGTQAQLRIRGAEANHSLLFLDGIRFNDPAAGNEARFELLRSDLLSRVEIVRGPQSALWGSEALGGVVAVSTPDPLGDHRATAAAEYGSDDFARLSGAFATGGKRAGLSATAAYVRSDGIDILGGGTGDRDGFENLTASLKGVARPADGFEAGVVGRYVRHDFEFDGTNDFFQRADTAEASETETYAARAWLGYGQERSSPWAVKVDAQILDSTNRNRDAGLRTNDSYGRRTRFGIQAARRFSGHELIAAAEREDEDFGTRDLQFCGASDRDLGCGRSVRPRRRPPRHRRRGPARRLQPLPGRDDVSRQCRPRRHTGAGFARRLWRRDRAAYLRRPVRLRARLRLYRQSGAAAGAFERFRGGAALARPQRLDRGCGLLQRS